MMTPTEAGFDGANGIYLIPPCSEYPNGLIYQLLRGRTRPEKFKSLSNQFAWWYPEGEDPKLIYANDEGKLFELEFKPYTAIEQ